MPPPPREPAFSARVDGMIHRAKAPPSQRGFVAARSQWKSYWHPDGPFRSFRPPGKLDTKPPDRVTREPRFCWSASFAVFGQAGNLLALTESEFRDLV
jgi:hypothetical protein